MAAPVGVGLRLHGGCAGGVHRALRTSDHPLSLVELVMRKPMRALALLLVVSSSAAAVSAPLRQVGLRNPAAPSVRSMQEQADIRVAVRLVSQLGTVSSVTRTREHNLAVGGASTSYHLVGRAIDVARRSGVKHSDIEAALLSAGYVLLESLDEGDHSHFAFGVTRAARQHLVRPFRQAEGKETRCGNPKGGLARPLFANGPDGGDCNSSGGSTMKDPQPRLVADEAAGKLLVNSGTIRGRSSNSAARE